MKRLLFMLLALLACQLSWAHDFAVENSDGVTIYYNKLSSTEVEVTYEGYKPGYSVPDRYEYGGKVVIPSSVTYSDIIFSVTSIGESAFSQCKSLISVTIPNSVIEIGESAFYGCNSLTYIYLGNSVSSIKERAFNECRSLTSITIPNSVTKIGQRAFYNCTGLSSVIIPDSVTEIELSAFYNTAIYNDESNWENNVLYIGHHLIEVNISIAKEYTIREGTITIANGAFRSSGLSSVTIPSSVISIGRSAFSGCSDLSSVNIPNTVTSIGSLAFEKTALYDNASNWEDCVLYIDNHLIAAKEKLRGIYTIKEGTITIADNAFNACIELTAVNIPNSVVRIGASAFYNCSKLSSVNIPNSITSIGDEAFYSCGLTSVTIPNSVTEIGSQTFSWCTYLTSVSIPNSITSIGQDAFSSCRSLTSITIPNSVTSIGDYAFSSCSNLNMVTIGKSVTSIGNYAFNDCSKLTSVAFNATACRSMGLFGKQAFKSCPNLSTLTISENVTIIPNYFFYDCGGLESVTIPASVTAIGQSAFYNCTGLKTLNIEDGETELSLHSSEISDYSFKSCAVEKLYVGRNLSSWGALCNSKSLTEVKIGDFVTSIGESAFNGCSCLSSINIPNSITTIGSSAFYGCRSLPSVTIPNSVTSIGEYAFSGCSGLISVTIPNSVTSIGEYAFSGCSGLISVTIPNSVTEIRDNTFTNCSSLKEMIIPSSVTTVGQSAFYNCTALKSLSIEDGDTELSLYSSTSNYYPFKGCSIENLYIGRNLSSWGALCRSSSLKTVEIGNSVTSMSTFSGCTGLTSVTIGDTITSIGDTAFSGCNALKSVIIGASVSSIAYNAFWGCANMASLWLKCGHFEITPPSSSYGYTEGLYISGSSSNSYVPLCPDKVFWLENTTPQVTGRVTYVSTKNVSTDENLTRMDFLSSYFEDEQGVKYIPVSPSDRTAMAIDFDYSSEPSSLTLPQSITYKGIDLNLISAGEYCLSRIGSLQHINVETHLPEIPNGFAYKCSSLQDFTVDRYPTRIGASAFEDCTSLADFVMLDWSTNVATGVDAFKNAGLKNLRIGRQLVYPDEEAASPFANNKSLETLWITDIPTEIGPYMFKGCDKLNEVNVGDRILNIRHYAFSGCKSISRFAFGAAVKTIEEEAFSDCTGMKDLYAEPIAPPVCGSQALDDINRWECTLHVQPQSKDSYAAAPQWKEFLFWETGFGITIDISSMILNEGETRSLRVMSNSAEGAVTWMSTNPSIVTIDESGTVYAVAAGNASVVAINSEGLMANCMITVIGDSGIEDVLTNSKTYVVRTENGNIIIEGAESNELVEIFNLSGVLSYKGSTSNIPSLNRGIYILRIGNQTFKLQL